METYNQIRDEISSLTRREQYLRLLSTLEWSRFRDKIISLDNHKCTKCNRPEGRIWVQRPIEQVQKERDEVTRHNSEFERKMKDPQYREMYIQILMGRIDGPIEGLRFYPSETKFNGEVVLQVHHRHYIMDKLPWEYSRKDVETLCSDCHKNLHACTEIYTYKDETLRLRKKLPKCFKCNGEGYIDKYHYRDNGICYECGGEGIIYSDVAVWE